MKILLYFFKIYKIFFNKKIIKIIYMGSKEKTASDLIKQKPKTISIFSDELNKSADSNSEGLTTQSLKNIDLVELKNLTKKEPKFKQKRNIIQKDMEAKIIHSKEDLKSILQKRKPNEKYLIFELHNIKKRVIFKGKYKEWLILIREFYFFKVAAKYRLSNTVSLNNMMIISNNFVLDKKTYYSESYDKISSKSSFVSPPRFKLYYSKNKESKNFKYEGEWHRNLMIYCDIKYTDITDSDKSISLPGGFFTDIGGIFEKFSIPRNIINEYFSNEEKKFLKLALGKYMDVITNAGELFKINEDEDDLLDTLMRILKHAKADFKNLSISDKSSPNTLFYSSLKKSEGLNSLNSPSFITFDKSGPKFGIQRKLSLFGHEGYSSQEKFPKVSKDDNESDKISLPEVEKNVFLTAKRSSTFVHDTEDPNSIDDKSFKRSFTEQVTSQLSKFNSISSSNQISIKENYVTIPEHASISEDQSNSVYIKLNKITGKLETNTVKSKSNEEIECSIGNYDEISKHPENIINFNSNFYKTQKKFDRKKTLSLIFEDSNEDVENFEDKIELDVLKSFYISQINNSQIDKISNVDENELFKSFNADVKNEDQILLINQFGKDCSAWLKKELICSLDQSIVENIIKNEIESIPFINFIYHHDRFRLIKDIITLFQRKNYGDITISSKVSKKNFFFINHPLEGSKLFIN